MMRFMSGFRSRSQRRLWFGLWREIEFWVCAVIYLAISRVARLIDKLYRLPEQPPRSRAEHERAMTERLHTKRRQLRWMLKPRSPNCGVSSKRRSV